MRTDEDLNNGYAFIEFESKEVCAKAIHYCKRETFRGERFSASFVRDSIQKDQEDDNGTSHDDTKPMYLKDFTDDELRLKLVKLAEVAKKNPVQAQLLLQQNKSFTYALLEAEYKQGMLINAVPGMDMLLDLEKV